MRGPPLLACDRVPALKQLKTRLTDDLVGSKSEQRLRSGIPGADFAVVGDGTRRVGRVFEEIVERVRQALSY